MNESKLSCDIFCAVVDNYGDAGVCWRLARQLAQEHGLAVRLWIDDMPSFIRLCPEANAQLTCQYCRGVDVRRWDRDCAETEPAQLVIEAFACELPQTYVAAMARQPVKPVWINLEYLSAEDWVDDCHALPSPHPSLPLVKHFFFPGFTPKTGGLLLENGLLERRDAFQNEPQRIAAYWRTLGIPEPATEETRVSLFCYENRALPGLLSAWEHSAAPVRCLAPEGRALPQIAAFFGQQYAEPGDIFQRGSLTLHVLPFTEQERYDELLWACDVNFVRGEDSFVRAQWAARPFVWHIYPQHDGVHTQKLRAFMERFCENLPAGTTAALRGLWENWNSGESAGNAWNDFMACRPLLRQRALAWAQQQSRNNLALNLLDFSRKIGRMRAFQNRSG